MRVGYTGRFGGLSWRGWAGAALLALGVGGCVATGAAGERFFTVHNALAALAPAQLGHVYEGSVGEGGAARVPLELEAQCVLLVAFGSENTRSVELQVLDAQNHRVAGRSSAGVQGAVQYCPPARGQFTVALRLGAGPFTLASWRFGQASAAPAAQSNYVSEGAPDSVHPVGRVAPGDTIEGEFSAEDRHGEEGTLVDDYELDLVSGQPVTILARGGRSAMRGGGNLDMYVILLDDEGEELDHDDDSGGNLNSRLVYTPTRTGRYYLRVTTFGSRRSRGTYTLRVLAGAHGSAR